MVRVSNIIAIFFLVLYLGVQAIQAQELPDTAMINRQTQEAYGIARSSPHKSMEKAHRALALSQEFEFTQGIADAFLALGMAHLAMFNHADSAYIYNTKALDIYEKLDDTRGKALACYALSYVYSFRADLKESERYAVLSHAYFKQVGHTRGIINTYSVLSYLAKQQNDLELALSHIHDAAETARSANDTIPLADVLNSLGNLYKEMGLFKNAIDTYFEALQLCELQKDSTGLSIAYGSIGLMYYYQKDYDHALEFNLKKLPIVQRKKELWEESKTYSNLANIYKEMAMYDSALHFNRKNLELNTRMNYKSGMVSAYHNMASTLLMKSEIDTAFYYGTKAVELARRINDPLLDNTLITMAKVYLARKNYHLALANALEAYRMATQQKRLLVIAEAAALVSDLYKLTGRKDLAYDYLKEYQQINDSISTDDFHRKITRLDLQYDFDKKQKASELARLEEQLLHQSRMDTQRLYLKGLVIFVILLVILTGLYIRHSRFRARYARMDFEQRLLRAQMNPHFIFNALCAVQDFILAGKSREANVFLTKIARLMRNILEHTRQEFVPLDQEIDTLRLYLDLQQMRFSQKFEYHFKMDEAIDPENISVPPMLAQPCVENSIEHGLLPLGRKGHLNISYLFNKGLLMLEVTDDGVGREQTAKEPAGKIKKKSRSTGLTQKRLGHLRKALKEKNIGYEIIDLYDGDKPKGTKVVMLLPYKKIFV